MPTKLDLHGERRLVLVSLFFLLLIGTIYYARPRPSFVRQFEAIYYNTYWNRAVKTISSKTWLTPRPEVGVVFPRHVSTLIDTELWLSVRNPSTKRVITPTLVITQAIAATISHNGEVLETNDLQVMLREGPLRDDLNTDSRHAVSFGPIQPRETATQLLWVRLLPLVEDEAKEPGVLPNGELIAGTVEFSVFLLNPDGTSPGPIYITSDPTQINMGQTIARGFVRTLLLPPWANGLIIGLALLWAFLTNAFISIFEQRSLERLNNRGLRPFGARTTWWQIPFWAFVFLFGANLTIFLGDVLLLRRLEPSFVARWPYLIFALNCLMLSALLFPRAYAAKDQTPGSYYDWMKRMMTNSRVAVFVWLGLVILALAPFYYYVSEQRQCRVSFCSEEARLKAVDGNVAERETEEACRAARCAPPRHYGFYAFATFLAIVLSIPYRGEPPFSLWLSARATAHDLAQSSTPVTRTTPVNMVNPTLSNDDVYTRLDAIEGNLLALQIQAPVTATEPVAAAGISLSGGRTEEAAPGGGDPDTIISIPPTSITTLALEAFQQRLDNAFLLLNGLATRPRSEWPKHLEFAEKEEKALRKARAGLPDSHKDQAKVFLDVLKDRAEQASALIELDKQVAGPRRNAGQFIEAVAASQDDASALLTKTEEQFGQWREALDAKQADFTQEPAASEYLMLRREFNVSNNLFHRLYLSNFPANDDNLVAAINDLRNIRDDKALGPNQTVRFLAHADVADDNFRVMPVTQAIAIALERLWGSWQAKLKATRQAIDEIKDEGSRATNAEARRALLPRLDALEPDTFSEGLSGNLPGWSSVYGREANGLPDNWLVELEELAKGLRNHFVTTREDLERR